MDTSTAAHRLIIEAGPTERHYWRDLWRYRELFYFLSWRDILVRYKQTVIGIAWSVLRPLLTMAVFTVVFGRLGGFPSDGVPYPVFVFAALLPWQMFSAALSESSNSLVNNAGMISKIYFPRLVIPASAVIVSLVDFLVSLVLLCLLMLWYGPAPGWRMLALPLFLGLALLAALGAGIWLAALSVKYRDFRYIVPFFLQIGFFVSPIGYSSGIIPAEWQLLYACNPLVGIIDGFRWTISDGRTALNVPGLCLSGGITLLLLWQGLVYFRRVEDTFADVV